MSNADFTPERVHGGSDNDPIQDDWSYGDKLRFKSKHIAAIYDTGA